MASLGFLGALAGASGQALDAIKTRQDQEREDRKMRMLEELRRDTAVYLADYKEQLDKKHVDKDLSSFDPTTGEFVSRNQEGTELGRRADPGMKAQYDFEQQKNQKSLLALDANIRQSDAAADSSRASASLARKSLAAQDEDTSPTIMSRANEITYRQKNVVEDLINGGVPAEVVQQLAMESVKQAAARGLAPSKAEQFFVTGAANIRSKYAGSPKNTNTVKARARSLDGF